MLRKAFSRIFIVVALIAIILPSLGISNAEADSLSDADRALDVKCFSYIDSISPKSEYQIRLRTDKTLKKEPKGAGRCNVSAITTLLNRRLAADGISGTFTVPDVLKSLDCSDWYTDGVIYSDTNNHTGKTKYAQYWYFSGSTGKWCKNNKTYSNGKTKYSVKQISGSRVKKTTTKANFYAYIASLLHQHPEGVAIRNITANHVAVIYKYTYSNGQYQLYVKDPVNNYSGTLEGSHIYKASGNDIYTNIDFIVYINDTPSVIEKMKIQVDEDRWHAFTASDIRAYQSVNDSSSVYKYSANQGIIITGFYPKGSKASGTPTWYRTKEGYYIKASDLAIKPTLSKEQSIGSVKHDNLSITVQSKYSNHWLTAQPYADTDKMVMVSKGTKMTVKKVIYNTAKHYWVQVEYNGKLYYACANNVEFVSMGEAVNIPENTKAFPSGDLPYGKGFNIRGTVSSTYKILTATGKVYSSSYTYPPKTITVNKNQFDLYSSAINLKSQGGIDFSKLPKGAYTFELVVNYELPSWKNQTRDDVDPITSTAQIGTYITTSQFTIGGAAPNKITVTGITLDKSSVTLLLAGDTGETSYLTASVAPNDATDKSVEWSSSDTTVATVVNGKVTAVGKGTATITATAADGSGKEATCSITVIKPVTSVTVSFNLTDLLYTNGASTGKLTANVTPADADNSAVTWSSSDSSIVSVDQSGNIAAKAVGTATITARTANGRQGTCQIEVRAYVDTVTLSGSSSVNVGSTIKLTSTVSPTSAANKNLTWSSSDTSIATVDTSGNVNGIKKGNVIITATAADRGTKAGTFSVDVVQPVTGITLSGASSLLKGNTLTLSATVTPANANDKSITWSSENTSIAAVNNGVVTGVAAGNTTIWATAADGSGVKTPYSIRVLQPVTGITISGEKNIPVDGIINLSAVVSPANADNRVLNWTSSQPTVASVNSQGVVTGVQPGSAVITASATDGSGVSKEYSIQVIRNLIAVKIEGDNLVHTGSTVQLTAIVSSEESLADTSVTWSSSDPTVVTVNANGVLTGVSNGTATITATSNAESYYTAEYQVTVDTLISQITVSGTNKIDAGSAAQLTAAVAPSTASKKQLIWTSSNAAVASVDGQGKVQGLSAGTATITATATDGSGVKGTLKVTVYPLPNQINITGEAKLLFNTSAQLSAEVLPANVRDKNVIWSSSDTSVATVSASGLVTAKANGTAIITATAAGNSAVLAQHEVTVTTHVSTVTLDAPERIDVGDMGTITATVLPATASNKQLVWSSSDEEVAVVDASGNVFGIAGGYATIKATTIDGSEIVAEAEIQIFQYVQSVSVDIDPVAYIGQAIWPDTIILPEDASEPYVTWTSSNENVVRIEEIESESDYGLMVVCLQPGVAKITATANDGSGVSGYAYIQVYPYTELTRDTATYNIYTSGNTNSTIGRVSLTADSASRAAEDKHGAVWAIEHVSGNNAAELGINERTYTYSGFTLANSVDLVLLGVNCTGSDTYRVTCTINGQADTCMVTVNVEEPASPLPDSISLPTTTFSAMVGEEIVVNVTPVVSPANSALPDDTNSFLYGVDSFNRYAQVNMGDDVFKITFSKAGTYTAYVRYQGANYQYDAYATFVVTTSEGAVPPEIEALSFDNSVMYMLPGETARFDVQISPASADESTLLWSSSDPDVVTVAADGTMTAVSTGTSIITVSAGNGVSANGLVAVSDSLLSIDWNPNDMIEVYVGGESRTVIQNVYLTPRASAQLTEAPAWTLKRQYGNNLTLTCEPITATNGNGELLYGCAIILKSVSNIGTTEYELTCSDGIHSASTTILVNANAIEDNLPSLVQWNNTTFTGTVNQRMTIYPVVQCWPTGTALPDEVTISIEGDRYWNAALKTSEYTVSRGMITLAFSEPGVYTANCVYSCSNMQYLVPITVRVADNTGNVPVRLMQLTLNKSEISIKSGNTAQLTAAFTPADASNKTLSWSSDNTSVATVSASGLITAVANGRAIITCTPADTNCSSVRCTVIVEDTFTVVQYQEMDFQYLQGEAGNPVAGFKLSDGTARRMAAEGLTPNWTLTRISGNAANVELREYNGTQFIVVTELKAGGTDTYEVVCIAGDYSWTGQASLEVHDLGVNAPEHVTLATTSYIASVGEEVSLDFTPVCEPAGSSIPAALEADYIGIGDIYSALMDDYRYTLFTAGDTFNLGFKKPGTYLLSRQYRSCNLTYVTECTIVVDDGKLGLLKCTDEEAVVYIGGKSSIASTCIIRDTSIEELYGDQLTWSAERLSGDCLSVALRADQSSASLYVVNAKEEGEEIWRVSCSFTGITDYVDITIHAVQARSELPETVILYQTDFDGMIGDTITVPLAVECSPEGTSLPNTDDGAWRFSTDSNTTAHSSWSFTNGQMRIVFSESGYYGGDLVYESGNVSYRFKVNFAITDEESVQAAPENLAISLNDEALTVYPEGETGIAIVNAMLTDSLDAYSLASVAAYAERNHAAWSVEILSGGACTLSVQTVTAGTVQLILDSITGSGDVTYRIQCAVSGKTCSAEGTIHVAGANESRPEPELKQSYFTTATGTVLTVDASLYDHTHTIKLCSGKDSVWNNAIALSAIGYEYETSGDLLLPVFYEAGSYITSITNRIGNLTFNKELIVAVYTSRALPASPSKLTFPSALQEIDDEAFEGLNINVVDLRGTSVKAIGSRAFAGVRGLMRVYIPGSVTSIESNAFAECTDFVICCVEGSYADTWAQSMKYPVLYNMD